MNTSTNTTNVKILLQYIRYSTTALTITLIMKTALIFLFNLLRLLDGELQSNEYSAYLFLFASIYI